jgi:hypothetical protein
LGIDGPVETTPMITDAEVRALRTAVKPHMIESETYPDEAARFIRNP